MWTPLKIAMSFFAALVILFAGWVKWFDSPRNNIQLMTGVEVPYFGASLEHGERFDGIDGSGGEYIFSLSEDIRKDMILACEANGGSFEHMFSVQFDQIALMETTRNIWRGLELDDAKTCAVTFHERIERKEKRRDGSTIFDVLNWNLIVADHYAAFYVVAHSE